MSTAMDGPGPRELDPAVTIVWCDGSSLGNPGPGGWAWWIDDRHWRAAGTPGPVTNNRMELAAVLDMVRHVPAHLRVNVHLDSQYTIDAVSRWSHGWRRNGWKTAKGLDVVNADLVRAITDLTTHRDITWTWVRGHAGVAGNEIVDAKARAAATAARDQGAVVVHGPT